MLLWILLVFLVLSIIGITYGLNKYIDALWVPCVFVFVVTLLLLVIGLTTYFDATPGIQASYHQEYKDIMAQLENNFYDNDNEVGKREVIAEAQAWNKKVVRAKAMEKDFWFGAFYPNVYDQYELIDIARYK